MSLPFSDGIINTDKYFDLVDIGLTKKTQVSLVIAPDISDPSLFHEK